MFLGLTRSLMVLTFVYMFTLNVSLLFNLHWSFFEQYNSKVSHLQETAVYKNYTDAFLFGAGGLEYLPISINHELCLKNKEKKKKIGG